MSVFKYVTAEAALRYLKTWTMRITPADQFNDPFEMRPIIKIGSSILAKQAPMVLRKALASKLSEIATAEAPNDISPVELVSRTNLLSAFFMREMSPQAEEYFLHALGSDEAASNMQKIRAKMEVDFEQSIADVETELPLISQVAASAMHEILPGHIGILCLSGSDKHPLMWAHYADSHRGALLEFDEAAPCFNRRRHSDDEFGVLRRVYYSDSRPVLFGDSSSDSITDLAFTKALEWAHEQEFRMLWPLKLSDGHKLNSAGQDVHLIDVPAAALRSITAGCKAEDPFVMQIRQLVGTVSSEVKVKVRVSEVDEHSFRLNYRELL